MSNGTQLNKSLSVGHIVATVGLIIGGFTFIYDLRESVAIQNFQLDSVEKGSERDGNVFAIRRPYWDEFNRLKALELSRADIKQFISGFLE